MNQRLTEKEVKFIIGQVLSGLKCLNAFKVVHRDVKMENILVKKRVGRSLTDRVPFADATGACYNFGKKDKIYNLDIDEYEFKIADLGLAKYLKGENELTKTLCG